MSLYRPAEKRRYGHSSAPVDMARCRAVVNQGDHRVSLYAQCTRKASVTREYVWNGESMGPTGFCGLHDPVRIEERYAAKDAERKKEMYARMAVDETRRGLIQAALDLADGMDSPELKWALVEAVKEAATAYRKARA